MRKYILTTVLCLAPLWGAAQDSLLVAPESPDLLADAVASAVEDALPDAAEGDAVPQVEDEALWLQQLQAAPLNLNRATRDELEQLPFLSSQQVMDLIAYRDRYGPLRSMGELRMVRSLDYRQQQLLLSCAVVGDAAPPRPPRLTDLLRHGRSELTATVRVPLYDRRGDANGYMGYKYRHWMRYELSAGTLLKAGVTASQDSGEPFLAGRNRWGYDLYNYYVQLTPPSGCVRTAIVGKYRLSVGMGLLMNSGFSLGKQATLLTLGRTPRTLRPHTSRSEADYLHGAALTLRPLRRLDVTLFASRRAIDATLTAAGEARTLVTSGYHRTAEEMARKGNTHLSALGGSATLRTGPWRVGLNAVYAHLDRSLEPDRTALFRRHYAHGRHFLNLSADYHLALHRLSLHGETALNDRRAVATVNALSYQATGSLSLVAVHRFYSYRYTTLFGHAFGTFGSVQNESGLYLGLGWTPLRHLRLQAYADYAYAPWARYLVSQSSRAWDLLAQADYQRRRYGVQLRYRAQLRQRDNASKTALAPYDHHSARLTLALSPSRRLSAKTQLSLSRAVYRTTDRGVLLGQQLAYARRGVQVGLQAAWFDTDSYQSRIYIYERQLQGEFAFPAYYGEGVRLLVSARADVGRHLRLSARMGYTSYFDRAAIGTGLQQVEASHLTDLDLQLRWRF